MLQKGSAASETDATVNQKNEIPTCVLYYWQNLSALA
jgi:hypothetical protein